jgi:methylenetetrahydrofolate dehydrogenase (NADP+)/methenyltetrahydrofolate cyclohydrolase
LAELLKGAPIAKKMYSGFLEKTKELKNSGIDPKINIFIAADDPGVEIYASMIAKNCGKAGIESEIIRSGRNCGTAGLTGGIVKANSDRTVHGIIVMLPLWEGLDEKKVLGSVSPDKDIDGVSPVNAGKLVMGDECFHPSTAAACREILTAYGYDPAGKHVVIIGRSNIVGKPLANILVQKGVDATVTVCHSRTKNLKELCRTADIIVAAIGSPGFITREFTHPGQVIVDVGMNEVTEKGISHFTGDADFENVKDHVKAITPVPGGVSPLTHTSLINNIYKAIELQTR